MSAAPTAHELRAEGIQVHFVGVKAVDGVDLVLRHGEIVGLIGPNGAGKTTLVNALTGFQPPTEGRVFMDDLEITGWPTHKLGRMGLARTFQAVRVFAELTAFENVELGALGVGASRKDARARAWELLERMQMADRGGAEGCVALRTATSGASGSCARSRCEPTFLLLDEPAAGMNEGESDDLMAAIGAIATSSAAACS